MSEEVRGEPFSHLPASDENVACHSLQGMALATSILGRRAVLHQIAQLLRHDPFVNAAKVEQADDGCLGAVQGHHVLEKDPEYQ